jgi:ParB family chromosome partitioning protein
MIISSKEVLNLPLDVVRPNPYQPRRIFDQNGLDELAASVKAYGILQPISVRQMANSSYELVAGERRLRACRLAGLAEIPAILVEINDTDSAVLAIIENLQRRDLHFFEEAEGFRNLINDYAFTQEILASRVGKNQSTIANKLRLLKISRKLQKDIIENELTERHSRALLRLNTEVQQAVVVQKIIESGLTVRKTEELIESMLAPKSKGKTIPFKAYIRDIRILTNSIKEDLEIMRHSGMDTNFEMQETATGYSIHITLDHAKKKSSSSYSSVI